MTDKELLELAAKAAGLNYRVIGGDICIQYLGAGYEWEEWNPLTDDGDALRLAVKIRLVVEVESWGTDVTTPSGFTAMEDSKDPYAATRRAIVRAAAEIGKTLDNQKPESINGKQWL